MVKRISEKQMVLAEGPVWDEKRQMLYYVDIRGMEIGCYDPKSGLHTFFPMKDMIGCIVLDGEGNLIAAQKDMLVRLDPMTGEQRELFDFGLEKGLRFNDGKCDCQGRLWVGTMMIDEGSPRAKGSGALYRYEKRKAVKVLDGMTIPNGIAFSEDNRFFYHIDTPTGRIDRYRFCAETGELSEKETVVQVEGGGMPDGMTIDREGMLWVALWGGFGVARYHPKTGQRLEFVPVPDRNVSCCTFGGADGSMLYITTARDLDGRGGHLYEYQTQTSGSAACRIAD